MAKRSQPTTAARERNALRWLKRRFCKRPGKHGGGTCDGNRIQNVRGDYATGKFCPPV